MSDAVHRVGFIGADNAGRAALDPARDIHPRHCCAGVVIDHPPVLIGNDAGAFVKRHARQTVALVADGAEDHLNREFLVHAGSPRAQGAALVFDQLVLLQAHALDLTVAHDFDRRDKKPDPDFAPPSALALVQMCGQDINIALMDGRSLVQKFLAEIVHDQVRRMDDQVDLGDLGQLADLRIGERGLGRAPPAQQKNLLDRALGQGLQRIVGDIGSR